MPGFSIYPDGEGLVVRADVSGLSADVVRRAGFIIDIETPLPGANPARPDHHVIERRLAPGADTHFLEQQLGGLGLYPTQVSA